jgi:tryptophan synthase beta chain
MVLRRCKYIFKQTFSSYNFCKISIAAAIQFARTEGIIPAPEPAQAIAAAIREALEYKKTGEKIVIVMAMCGHDHFDLASYEKYLKGNMVDLSYYPEKLQESLARVPQVEA